jgi:hypothetical protein
MAGDQQFRILMPDGMLSREVFALAPQQPRSILAGCVLVVHEPTGKMLTLHETRLFPVKPANTVTVIGESKRVCVKCGKVQGVVQDQVACPNDGGGPCGILEPASQNTRTINVRASDSTPGD